MYPCTIAKIIRYLSFLSKISIIIKGRDLLD